MKKLILTTIVLLGISSNCFAGFTPVMYDQEGNAFKIVAGKAYPITIEESKAFKENNRQLMEEQKESYFHQKKEVSVPKHDNRTLEMEYVHVNGSWLEVGLKLSHKGSVTCRALQDGNTISIQEWHVDSQYENVLIPNAGNADSASCSYSN